MDTRDLRSTDPAQARAVAAAAAPLRLMAVHAHPDDESSKGAASLAKYADDGVGVMVVSCTGGERGDILNPKFKDLETAIDIPALRIEEMARAAEILGVAHAWLGFQDSGYHEGDPDTWTLPEGCFGALDPEVEIEALVRLVRAFRPHVMTTYDENGGYPHPDHIRCHEVSVAAYEAAADPARYPDAGPAWQVSKLYYDRIMNASKMRAIQHQLSVELPDSPLNEKMVEMMEWMGARPDLSTTHVDVSDSFDARDAALRAHASQVSPDSAFFFWPNDLQKRAWPTEDFQLVDARVETSLPETDLFAGIEA